MKFRDAPSVHFNERKDGKTPALLILHYTDTLNVERTLATMQNREVSAHYVVDEDGTVIRVVDESKRAWHAGKSWWAGEEDVNSASIGIEIQNPGHQHGYRAFPEAQVEAVTALCRDVIARHRILPRNVVGHSDICPGRREKPDPGHLFPWARLARDGVGLWLDVTDKERAAAGDVFASEEKTRALLAGYGYDPRVDFRMLLTAFQRHFVPEKFAGWEDHPPFAAEDAARLVALCRAAASW